MKSKRLISLAAALAVTAAALTASVSASADTSLKGDINANGVIESEDALLLLRHSVGMSALDPQKELIADVNGDGSIDSADALGVLRISVGLTDSDAPSPRPAPTPTPTPQPDPTPEPQPGENEEFSLYARQVLQLVNEERAKEGVPALELDKTLCEAAQVRSDELLDKMAHERPDGRDVQTVMDEYNWTFGVDYFAFGENIAAGQPTPAKVVQRWMESPGHRANIMNPDFKKLGLGYTHNSKTMYHHYWSQLFTD